MEEQSHQECIKLLEREFYYQGFRFIKCLENGRYYCYEKRNKNDMLIGYEVFERRILKSTIIEGRSYSKREAFPRDEDFGKWAWYYGRHQLVKAIRKMAGK